MAIIDGSRAKGIAKPYTIDLSMFRMIDPAGWRVPIERVGQECDRRPSARPAEVGPA
jgi:hypothetical protein